MPNAKSDNDLEKESKLEEDWAKSLWPPQKTWTFSNEFYRTTFHAYNLFVLFSIFGKLNHLQQTVKVLHGLQLPWVL